MLTTIICSSEGKYDLIAISYRSPAPAVSVNMTDNHGLIISTSKSEVKFE
jgi:hypothetical protein